MGLLGLKLRKSWANKNGLVKACFCYLKEGECIYRDFKISDHYFLNKKFNKQFWAWILTFVLNGICLPKGVNSSTSGLPQARTTVGYENIFLNVS